MEEIALTALPRQDVDDSEHDSSSVNQASLSQSKEARARNQALPSLPSTLEAHPKLIPEFPATESPLIPPQKTQRKSWPTVAALETDQLREPLLPSPETPGARPLVSKALPTVKDHVTDVLTPEGDEYIPREFDEAGERKVSPQGHALEGREFR